MARTKTQKGSVVVRSVKNRLRLVWTFCGKRYYFALELQDSKANRAIAELKAKQIERDIANDLFDPTLEKYRAAYQRRAMGTPATEVFEKYIAYKAKTLRKRSLEKYTFTLSHLRQFFRDEVATEGRCEQFKDWLANRMEPITLKQRISFLKSAWAWAMEKKLVSENPWVEPLRQVKVPPKQRPKPFTAEERQRIVAAFRGDRYFAYYADFVEFLLGAGCRPGEARYRFESVEVKEPNFRIDGVFLPPDDARSKTVFFAEVQFQRNQDLYHRFVAESMLYLYRNRAIYNDWYGVIIFPFRSLEPENQIAHRSLLNGDQMRRVYLDELGDPREQSVGISLMQLTIAPEETAVEQARGLLERLRGQEGETLARDAIIEVITTIAVYKFTNFSREEVEAMLGLQLEDSRILREVKEEGREEGRQEKALATLAVSA